MGQGPGIFKGRTACLLLNSQSLAQFLGNRHTVNPYCKSLLNDKEANPCGPSSWHVNKYALDTHTQMSRG